MLKTRGPSFEVSYISGLAESAQSITISANVIAADAWQSLITATQKDYCEKGLIVAKRGSNFIRTRVYGGTEDKRSSSCIDLPVFPFGLIGLLFDVDTVTEIHTHPMPPDLNHIATTPPTDKDIHSLTHGQSQAIVTLDRGGAHLLVKNTHHMGETGNTPAANLVSTTLEEVMKGSKESMDLAAKIAGKLSIHGISYFYTSQLQPKNGYVELQRLGDSQ